MKKAALGFIALAMSFMANTAQAYNGEGDIRSINRCDYDGKVLSAMAADEFAIAGDTVYFRIRLKNVNSQEIKTSGAQNRWVLRNISGDDDAEPTVGVYVSGQFRVAKIVDVKVPTEVDVNANGSSKAEWLPCYTDLICAYTVQPGDFAFPMTLANSSKGEVNANGGDSYWLNPDFELQAKEYTSAPPWDESSTYSIVKSTFTFGPEVDGYIAQSESAFWSRDFSLDQANIRIKTLDFVESEVFMDEGDPRIIDVKFHGGTNSVGGSAYLKIKNDGKFDLVKTGAASVTVKSMKGPDGDVAGYQCLKVEVPAGVSSFQIKVLGNENGAAGVLYLSSTEAFAQGKSGNHIENYITAAVKCGPPKRRVSVEINPADLTLTNGTAKATVTPSPDYATALRRLTVKLSTAYTNDVKVKVDASMISAAASGIEPVGEYIGLSTLAVDGYLGTDDTVTFTVDEMNRGLLSKDIYVYVLGGDAETSGTGKGILFTPSIVDNAAAGTFYNESPITSVLMIEKSVPQIIEPTAGHRYDNIPGGVEYTFEIKVADGYNDIGGEYEIEWKKKTNDANAKVSFEDDVKKPNSEGYLYVKVKYNSGEYTSRFRVKNASGSYSEWRTITVQVDDAKQAYAVVEGFEDVIEFGEIDEEGYENVLDVRFHLNVPHEDTVYAFLVPLDEASSNKVEFVSGKGKEIGIAIPGGTTNSVQTATLRLLDGCDETLPISYRIELRALKYPDSELFEGAYECKDLELYVNNVYPVINSVGMSGSLDVSENGGTFSGRASIGLQKVFTLDVIDSEADWLGNAHAVWTFADPNGFVGAPVEYDGPLCDVCVTNIFTVPGTYTCNVKLQDKDMLGGRRYSESFEFKVMVNDTPSVLIEFPNSNTFLETDAEKGTGYFDVKLSMPATKPVVVELDCTQVGADGVLNISTNRLEFRAGQVQQRVLIEELDGTADSMSFKGGFSVTAKVVTTDTNEDGIEFKDVYLPVTEKMYVANENPTIVFPISTGGTNDASINVEYNLSWKIADVDFDLADGLSVVWTTSEGDRWVAPGTDVSEGVYVAKFKTGGAKTVTMTVTDKDGGVSSVSLFYKVAASKQVYVYPMGPYDGGLTSLSRRYATASGIGEGRAWADGTRVSTNFVHTYTYGATMGTATVSAKGYVDGQEDGDINMAGNSYAQGDTAYRYSDSSARDSFFYAWLISSKDEEATTYTGSALVSPASPRSKTGIVQYPLSLPAELAGDDSNPMYPDSYIEAFFSKELYPSDNMGDMNADGVPDYFATLYWSMPTGETKTVPEAMTGQAISGANGGEDDKEASATASDLVNIAAYNGDGDFLPAACNSSNPLKPANRYWGPGRPFTTVMEIRGLDTGLNEAGVSDYELTEAEKHALFAAAARAGSPAADYAAATNWAAQTRWTPEAVHPLSNARLNPLNNDTDGDGFDDGWEYYFWYYAKIGAVVDGKWSRLEGRRFDPASPSMWVRISSEEIASAFDPHVARSGGDFDNDGLSDIEEYVLGTNPCDFDSSETGVSDLWSVMMGLDANSSVYGDNPDCDFMARCEYAEDTFTLFTFADGKLFALPTATAPAIAPAEPASTSSFYKVDFADASYWVASAPVTYTLEGVECLATNAEAFAVLEIGGSSYLGEKVVLPAGMPVASVATGAVEVLEAILPETGFTWTDPGTLERGTTAKALAVFNYGGDGVTYVPCTSNATTYADLPVGVAVVKAQPDVKVTLIHNQVMVQYGFDPRVAWNIDTYGLLDNRWRRPDSEDAGSMGAAGIPTNTVAYTSRDEFLVMQYRFNAQREAYPALSALPSASDFILYTTYPNLPVEFVREKEYGYKPFTDTNEVYVAYWDSLSKDITVHGADTDHDGVPDGWELYVNSNPNLKADGSSYKDGDKLSLVQEYAGVDSCNAYTNRFEGDVMIYPEAYTITKNHPGKTDGWWNKFFPTNPDSDDTDGDGVNDSAERDSFSSTFPVGRNSYSATHTFIYGDNAEKYAADGSTTCFRGGGLNPCTVDTDGDLLPDAWEYEFAGIVFNGTAPSVALADADLLKLIQADAHQAGVDTNSTASIRGGMDGTFSGDSGYDFDQDGLLNFQEYLVQSLRHLRYDDFLTPLMGVNPSSRQFVRFLPFSAWDGNAFHKKCNENGFTGLGAWQFRDLGYFALPPHSWDMLAQNGGGLGGCANYAHSEGAGYRIMLRPSFELPMIGRLQAGGYASTDPRRWDTDNDGMDDYYEIFHGLNPILGSAAAPTAINEQGIYNFLTYDVIGRIYGGAVNAWCNHWTGWSDDVQPPFDAIKHPWMIGTMECDADGDGLRNDEESLKVNVAKPQNTHTDPTPLWMTDSTSTKSASFTSQYYRPDPYLSETPNYDELTSTPDLFRYPWKDLRSNTVVYAPGSGGINRNWMFSFEENEGYDTDHDFKRDTTELVKGVEPTSDPLNFMDPNRRQALYLPGENSAAVSYDSESRRSIGTEPDMLKQFTVECWVRPDGDRNRDVVIMERVCVYGGSTLSNGQTRVRANFRVGVDAEGKVYGEYEGTTVDSGSVRVTGLALDAGRWTHVAFTYNGYTAALYMDGAVAPVASANGVGLLPANGIDGILQESGTSVMPYTGYRALPCANVIGASALTPNAVSVNPETTWNDFAGFFKGWIDEVRVWDGARAASDIHADYLKRFSFDDVSAQRETVYKAWRNGATRADADPRTALPAELLLHYNFAALPGGVESGNVMTTPTGFQSAVLDNVRRPNGRDLDVSLNVGWWSQLAGVNSKVYDNYAVVPWIPNTVAHLPLMDGSSIDSQYWNSYAAGLMGAEYVGLNGYAYPNSANPYSSYVYRFEKLHHLNRLAVAGTLQVYDSAGYPIYDRYAFQLRSDFVGTTDLIPLGGAFAKRGADFWDGQGAMDAWTTTSVNGGVADSDKDGIPDWAEALGYTSAEAYIRALAEGLLPSAGSENKDDAYVDVADANNDGLYDWWQRFHDLKGTAKADTDKDGLADFAEYLVTEVFGFGEISPVLSKSNGKEFDYFRKAGSLYLGELFTDHDFMEDDWENLFANSFVDAAQYDPSADADADGWSNYAECRAGTLPDRTSSIVIGSDELADYPIPTIRVKASYSKASSVDAPIVVRAFSANGATMDAEWTVPGSSVPVDCERAIGLNPGRKMTFDLGPGVIVPGMTKLMMRDTSEVSSDGVWQNPSATTWREVLVETVIPGNQDMGNLSKVREPVGTVSYPTSQVEIDFTALQGYVYYNTESGVYSFSPMFTNQYMRVDMKNAYVKLLWQSMRVPGERSWNFTLSKPAVGHVREGLNTFVAFIDLDGNGVWTESEPMGVTRNVDVRWNNADVEISIFDDGVRFDLGLEDDENSIARETQVKVYRSKVNEKSENAYGKIVNPLILDFSIGSRSDLHEGDFMKDGELDIDWSAFTRDVLRSTMVVDSRMNVTSVTYTVEVSSNREIVSNRFEVTRVFTPTHVTAVPCNANTVNYGIRPVFKWTIPTAEDTFTAFSVQVKNAAGNVVWNSGYNTMPAKTAAGEYVWLAPLYVNDLASGGHVFANTNNYTWEVSLHNARYQTATWSKAQQFRMNVFDSTEANAGSYGAIKAAVKYFGPGTFDVDKSTLTDKIRVEAYKTPDFAGVPAGRGFIQDYASVTNDSHDANVTIVGLEAGTYYLRAFIDSDGDCKRSDWESWGYVCPRGDIVSGGVFSPTAIEVGYGAAPVEVCYIEDADVDQDCLPDVYEYNTVGADKTDFLAKKGVAENTHNGYISVNPKLQTAIDNLIGAGNTVGLLSAGVGQVPMQLAALSLGVPTLENTVRDSTLAIKSLTLENGAVNLTIGAEADEPSLGTVFVSNGKVMTTVVVYYTAQLGGDWEVVKSENVEFVIDEGSVGDTFKVPLDGLDTSKGFFKVELK